VEEISESKVRERNSNKIFKTGKPSSNTFNVGAPTFCVAQALQA
jgi:hypothetical protein